MNTGLLGFALILVVLQIILPTRWAFLPLLIAACHTPAVQFFGNFTAVRLIIIFGLLRAAIGGNFKWSWHNPLDMMLAAWSVAALVSSVAHEYQGAFIFRAGLVFNVLGIYLYGRAFLSDNDSLGNFSKGFAFVIIPYALMMLLELTSGANLYSNLGARLEVALIRDGTIRAAGPFGTPILSGTLGAAALPFMVLLWQQSRGLAIAGLIASVLIVFCSGSSGPIATMGIGLGLVAMWRFRAYGRNLLWGGLAMILVMQMFRERPIWYLMSLMDFVGGSTGWHRANLIDSAYKHLNEWWLFGTDYTRHWMPYGLPNVPEHCDLTNYYVHLGVIGGLPLMILLIMIAWKSVRAMINNIAILLRLGYDREAFCRWCVAAALIAHAVTFLSISYYDQISVFFWILIGALFGWTVSEDADPDEEICDQKLN